MPNSPQTVVITGASSGIGRATAHAFARRSAQLVLAARDPRALDDVCAECRKLGGDSFAAAADMSDAVAADHVAQIAIDRFGRIDVWVNGAAVLIFGMFDKLPPQEFDRVISTNISGYANGARAALAVFRRQSSGVLVNVGSMLGVVGEPNVSAYVASKFAIRGLSACLRQELAAEPNIHVCVVLPAAVDTPIYQKAANHHRRRARAILPVYRPERIAEAIVKLSERPRPELAFGSFAKLLMIGTRLAPRLTEHLIRRAAPSLQFEAVEQDPTSGNLFSSRGHAAVDGGWQAYWRGRLLAASRRKRR